MALNETLGLNAVWSSGRDVEDEEMSMRSNPKRTNILGLLGAHMPKLAAKRAVETQMVVPFHQMALRQLLRQVSN